MANYDYYRIFYYVAQYKSFSRAAEILENNQPNITRCMNNLENELGCKLFVRTNRGVTLTPEGTRLYEHVAVAFEQIEVAEKEISMDNSLESGIVTIGASETALRLMLLNKLEEFHEKYPRVRLRISNHSSPQAVKALEDGLVDFAVVTTPITIKSPFRKPHFTHSVRFSSGEENIQISLQRCRVLIILPIYLLYHLAANQQPVNCICSIFKSQYAI